MSVGIDIGSKSIKIVELEKQGSSWAIRGSGIVGYSGTPAEHIKDEKEMESLGQVIKNLHKEARISDKVVSIALPEPQVFTRTIKFPLLTDQEIASAVKWEAEQYIPIPLSEAIVEHQIIERKETTTPPEVVVLLVAVPQTLVEKYLKILQFAGLSVNSVETEMTSLVRCLAPEGQTVLLVDFGAGSTDIAIAKNANLVFSRSIPTAGDAFTRAVAQNLGIEYARAEEYKKTYGLTANLEGKIKGALDPVIRMVTDEIKKAIHFYQTEEKEESPRSVIISGGTSGMPEVTSVLTKALNLEVIMGNSFSKISLDSKVAQSLANYGPLYSIAVGLAMR
ncbi:MAG TPA: type IV pilus assembly protein PilM [Patescibacteria group bacterium]|nr:type IV pilus assembly protein PilM [Patescibacteria group bacterium]